MPIGAAELHHEGLPLDGDRLTSTSARECVSAIKTPSIKVKVKAGVFQCPECQHIERNAGLHDLSIEPLRQHDIALEQALLIVVLGRPPELAALGNKRIGKSVPIAR